MGRSSRSSLEGAANICVVGAVAGSAVVGGLISGVGAKKAAQTQADAARAAANTQQAMQQVVRGDLMPYNQAGQTATQALLAFYGLPAYGLAGGPRGQPGGTSLATVRPELQQALLERTPGYQFLKEEADKGVERMAAAKGGWASGATLKELSNRNVGLASSYALPNYLGGLQYLSGQGENAAAQTGLYGTRSAEGIAGTQMAGGSAQATGQAGFANSIGGSIMQGAGLYGSYDILKNPGKYPGFYPQSYASQPAAASAEASSGYPGAFPYYPAGGGGVWGSELGRSGQWGPAWDYGWAPPRV